MYLTAHRSDLFFRICRIYHINDKYVKCKVLYFYKSSKDICYWTNPTGRPKNFKLLKNVYDSFRPYETKE